MLLLYKTSNLSKISSVVINTIRIGLHFKLKHKLYEGLEFMNNEIYLYRQRFLYLKH